MAAPALIEELDKRFRQTCKVVLKGEVGSLEEYRVWLSERADAVFFSPSCVSGKQVAFSSNRYCAGSKRLAFPEVDYGAKAHALPQNSLKDIDSLLLALQERFCYAGGIVLGNCTSVEGSTNVSDSHFILNSASVGDSKYVAYSSMVRLCDHIFGTAAPGESSCLIRCNDTYRLSRALELWMTANSNDCYYVFALNNCSECMFSFNLRNRRHCIGNVELPKEKYLGLKASLLEQMRGELEKKKRLPSLMEIISKAACAPGEAKAAVAGKLSREAVPIRMLPMEEAFSRTTKLLLGTNLIGLGKYRAYLIRGLDFGEKRKSIASGKPIFVCNYAKYTDVPANSTVLEDESLLIAQSMPPQEGIEKISLATAHEFIGKTAYCPLDFHDGTNSNISECMAYAYSSNVHQCSPCVQVKDSAYNLWPRSSEHLFGCNVVFDSSFCVRCSHSVKLSRCFEVDSSRDCADCYFCHNCENVQSGIFCFNAKNLRYAIGNVEVGRDEFLRVKGMLMRRIVPALEEGRQPGLDIFNLACIGKKAKG